MPGSFRPIKSARRYLPLVLLGLLAVALIALGLPERLSPSALLNEASHWLGLSSSRPLLTLTLMIAIVALTTAVGLPGAVALFAASGFLLGVPAAMVAAAAGNVIGTSVLFFALRHAFFRPENSGMPDSATMQRIRHGFERNPLAYALFLRALPMLPNGAATAALAAVRCPWSIFLTASALGPQANAALMGWLGAQFAREVRAGHAIDIGILADPRWWLPLLILAALMLVPIVLKRRSRADHVEKPLTDDRLP